MLFGFGNVATVLFTAADVVDGEVTDDGPKTVQEEESLDIGASPDAGLAFHFVQPADANVVHGLFIYM